MANREGKERKKEKYSQSFRKRIKQNKILANLGQQLKKILKTNWQIHTKNTNLCVEKQNLTDFKEIHLKSIRKREKIL